MKLTVEQHEQVVFYLQHLDIDSQELFEEFYDHIVCSYEARLKKEPELEIKTHIWHHLHIEFGGVTGFKEVIKKHQKGIHWQVTKKFLAIALSYFKWPSVIYTALIFLVLLGIAEISNTPIIIYTFVMISLLTPYAIILLNQVKFKRDIKVQKPGYYRNMRNSAISEIGGFTALSTYYLFYFSTSMREILLFEKYFNQLPIIPTILMAFSTLFSVSLLKLIKEDFKTKLLTT
ncbi:hypothetical protein AWW67_08520 [Roseivirga seohaensis]|uniref:Uncharacterized protein n=1 Tax=Roseivirga seohaensis TaxID=1914963 RepID=A0A150XQ51_9BACT|nr:hypothetical protein [Roseivirga seohaensis]KYG80856.1 hypothetical protein AWW67_08520 [Roseivirga seohaensis]